MTLEGTSQDLTPFPAAWRDFLNRKGTKDAKGKLGKAVGMVVCPKLCW